MLTLEFFIEALAGNRPPGDTPVANVVIDSRKVERGGVFFAIKGEHTDGHEYVADALQRGAVAAFIERDVEAACPVLDLRESGGAHSRAPLQTPVCIRIDNTV